MQLKDFDFNVKRLFEEVVSCKKILGFNGVQTNSLAASLFRILRESHCDDFDSFIGRKQDLYDEGADFDFNSFMKLTIAKYNGLVKDNKWSKTSTNKAEIVALKAEMSHLRANLAKYNNQIPTTQKENTYDQRSGGMNNGRKMFNKNHWKRCPPGPNESHTKQNSQGRTFYWCKHHGFWSPSHGTDKCILGSTRQSSEANLGHQQHKKLRFNLADMDLPIEEDATLNFSEAVNSNTDVFLNSLAKGRGDH